ncbi:MAG: pyridoxal phosphate-dependent aminotransferase [Ectothiorhodospiraceae bacterium]|nr:pyridoxal phosphate-dependent aminotransferase [Ectothiorhodospiraceae bacterium]
MTIELSERVRALKPSATLAVTARATELRAAGRDVISLSAGEPDFDTPAHVKEAAKKAIDEGKTKYTVVDGIPELKQAIIGKFKRDNGLSYQPDQIMVSCGGKHSLHNVFHAVLNPGDEAIIPSPYWVSYPDMVQLTGARPVIVDTGIENGFRMSAEQLERAITPRTKLVMLNSPSNPTGVCYTRADFQALGEVLARHPSILIATDDIYELISWGDEPFCNIVMACPDLYDRTVVVNGMAKGYAMTGWRIGYTAGPVELTRAMRKLQGQTTSNPTTISQWASVAALNGDHQCVRDMVKVFKERHDYVVERLNRGNGVRCLAAQGAFYAFPDVRGAIESINGIDNDIQLAEHLIEKAGVAMVPGTAFGAPGYLRMSYATSMENLEKALDRLEGALAGS